MSFKKTLLCLSAATLMGTASLSHAATFTVTSSTVRPNQNLSIDQVYNGFGCYGRNISPAISWQNAPAGTKSFAITAYDPDAPTGSGWWHWIVYNIPADATGLDAGVGSLHSADLPDNAIQAMSDYGAEAWGGVCPPPGDKPHRYIFTVHALGVEQLDLPEDSTSAMIRYVINANTIAKASFTAQYSRPKE